MAVALGNRAREIFDYALAAVQPQEGIHRHLSLQGDLLRVGSQTLDLSGFRHIYVAGFGKAAASMAQGLEEVLGPRIHSGVVVVKDGYAANFRSSRITALEASHPVPDQRSLEATERILHLVDGAGAQDLVVFLVSGGGSSLFEKPAGSLTLEHLQHATSILLYCGADIREVNTVRKHLSAVKGGRLMEHIHPARCLTVILSDVLGSPLDAIASGPTVADPSTYAQALEVVDRYQLQRELPRPILWHLEDGAAGKIPETPKPGNPIFDSVMYQIIGDNSLLALAALEKAREMGLNALLLTTWLEGEAREVARVLGAIAHEVRTRGLPVPPPAAILASGEPTVTVKGRGRGGRCQELALAFALAIEEWADEGVTLLAADSDGTDGPTPSAGALVDGGTIRRARAKGIDPRMYLDLNDSYCFFRDLGEQLVIGPTETNANDLIVMLVT